MKRIVFLLLLVFLFSCTGKKSDRPQILVSPKSLAQSFWLSVKAGAEQAGRDFHADIIWKGPSQEIDIAGQIAIVEDYINKRVDAIVLAACDAKGLISTIAKAKAAGIPVITIDSGVESDLPECFVATDNVAAARKAAEILAELCDYEGDIALVAHVPGAATSIWRVQGFKEGLQAYPNLRLVAEQYSHSEVAIGMAVTENILTAHPDLKGIFATAESSVIGCAQGLVSKGLAGKVKLVGFDTAPPEVLALNEGTIHALMLQNPFKMGYEGVKAAVDVLAGREVPKRIDTGITVVTKDNINTKEIQMIMNPLKRIE